MDLNQARHSGAFPWQKDLKTEPGECYLKYEDTGNYQARVLEFSEGTVLDDSFS